MKIGEFERCQCIHSALFMLPYQEFQPSKDHIKLQNKISNNLLKNKSIFRAAWTSSSFPIHSGRILFLVFLPRVHPSQVLRLTCSRTRYNHDCSWSMEVFLILFLKQQGFTDTTEPREIVTLLCYVFLWRMELRYKRLMQAYISVGWYVYKKIYDIVAKPEVTYINIRPRK